MKIWFDTEFIEDGRTIELLSIGMIRQDGATFYAEPMETDRSRASAWVKENVLPHLHGPIKCRENIAEQIVEFAGPNPEFWAYYADYDWVVLCQLFGRMIDLPQGWPMYCRDIKQEADRLEGWMRAFNSAPDYKLRLPEQGKGEHHALADARWNRLAWEFLRDYQCPPD